MHRKRTIVGMLVAFVSALIPIVLILLTLWQMLLQNEQKRLDSLAERLINRADLSIAQVTDAFKTLSALQITPCSPEHIMHMRKIMFQTIPIDKTVYFKNGGIKCSSWGTMDQYALQYQIDFVTVDGVAVAIEIPSMFSENDHAMLLTYESYGVFINPNRFVNIIVEEDVQLAFATFDGTVITATTPSLNDFFHRLIVDQNDVKTSQYLHSVVRKGTWSAAAIKPKPSLLQYLENKDKLLLAIEFIAGLPIFVLVLYLLLKRPSLRSRLRQALINKEFKVHYQPIIDPRTGRCSGGEALLRWQQPDGSMVRPDVFIPLAEESGLIKPITDQVIEIVAREMQKMLVTTRELHININLCADDIKTGRVLSIITDKFAKAGVRPEQIWLEVTEHEVMDINSARVFLDEARKRGHVVAIDDFGTGYSSLQYLQELPIDVLKIDKSFVASIGTESASSPVVSCIIDMAKRLKLTLVAEGVETQSQADYLAARGVGFIQGWFYYKALPAEKFLEVVLMSNSENKQR